MKRFNMITAVFLAVIFLMVFAINVSAQDKKDIKKQEVKVQKTEKKDSNPENCAKACQEKIAKTDCCKNHDPAKCNHEKCDCGLKPGSKECLEKHAKSESTEQKPGECCHSDQAKKEASKKELDKK